MRNKTVDVAKGLGILLVVIGHNDLVLKGKGELFRIIFSFHLPFFFLLSGLFLARVSSFTQCSALLVQKADALLKPFFSVLFLLLLTRLLFHSEIVTWEYVLGIFWATGASIEPTPLWFLPHLFLCIVALSLITYFIEDTSRGRYVIWIAFLMAALYVHFVFSSLGGLVLFGFVNSGLPFSIDLLFLTLPFVLIGFFYKKSLLSFEFNFYLFLTATAAFCCLHYFYDESMDLNKREYGNYYLVTFQAVLGCYIAFSISHLLSKSICAGFFSFIGSCSLFILIFHSMFQQYFTNMVRSLTNSDVIGWGAGLIAGVFFPVLIYLIARKFSLVGYFLLPRKA